MKENLAVRAYGAAQHTHLHDYHQVVVPLQGTIAVSLNETAATVPVGQCVVINRNVEHKFSANRNARFLVADLHDLPDEIVFQKYPFATISNAFRLFCLFSDLQLISKTDDELKMYMIAAFKRLLSLEDIQPRLDRRIIQALTHIENGIDKIHTLQSLAKVSSLSISQFKVQFKKHTGMSAGKYLLLVRMERARALLINTDTPISIIAEQSGYTDQSAFCRRFRDYYGVSPNQYRNTM